MALWDVQSRRNRLADFSFCRHSTGTSARPKSRNNVTARLEVCSPVTTHHMQRSVSARIYIHGRNDLLIPQPFILRSRRLTIVKQRKRRAERNPNGEWASEEPLRHPRSRGPGHRGPGEEREEDFFGAGCARLKGGNANAVTLLLV